MVRVPITAVRVPITAVRVPINRSKVTDNRGWVPITAVTIPITALRALITLRPIPAVQIFEKWYVIHLHRVHWLGTSASDDLEDGGAEPEVSADGPRLSSREPDCASVVFQAASNLCFKPNPTFRSHRLMRRSWSG